MHPGGSRSGSAAEFLLVTRSGRLMEKARNPLVRPLTDLSVAADAAGCRSGKRVAGVWFYSRKTLLQTTCDIGTQGSSSEYSDAVTTGALADRRVCPGGLRREGIGTEIQNFKKVGRGLMT